MQTAAQRHALICGSIAYDTIMVFGDRFRNHILPDKIHMLNVSFLVPQLRREFGGCAGNIAYNLKLLGDSAYPMATVGRDFGPYREWMNRNGVAADHVRVIDSEHTAQAFITTDLDDNQITIRGRCNSRIRTASRTHAELPSVSWLPMGARG